jgi:hypothetical protein
MISVGFKLAETSINAVVIKLRRFRNPLVEYQER